MKPRPLKMWHLFVFVFLLWLIASVFFVMISKADTRTGTFACNFKNNPTVAPYMDYERVVLSPRAIYNDAKLDSLHAGGAQVFMWTQPNVAFINGQPITDSSQYPWDAAVWATAVRTNGVLLDSTGAPAEMFGGGLGWSAKVLDFRNPAFVTAYANLIVTHFPTIQGIHFDYGCGDLSWMALAHVDPSIWPAWQAGWWSFLSQIHQMSPNYTLVCQCDLWPNDGGACQGVYLERAGTSLNPPLDVWRDANIRRGTTANPAYGRAMILQEDSWAQRRRLFSAMALLTDGLFDQSPGGGDSDENVKDMEHFTLNIGPSKGPWETVQPRVYKRYFSRGVALINLSNANYLYNKKYTILPMDGIVAQTRNAKGQYIQWITDYGR